MSDPDVNANVGGDQSVGDRIQPAINLPRPSFCAPHLMGSEARLVGAHPAQSPLSAVGVVGTDHDDCVRATRGMLLHAIPYALEERGVPCASFGIFICVSLKATLGPRTQNADVRIVTEAVTDTQQTLFPARHIMMIAQPHNRDLRAAQRANNTAFVDRHHREFGCSLCTDPFTAQRRCKLVTKCIRLCGSLLIGFHRDERGRSHPLADLAEYPIEERGTSRVDVDRADEDERVYRHSFHEPR